MRSVRVNVPATTLAILCLLALPALAAPPQGDGALAGASAARPAARAKPKPAAAPLPKGDLTVELRQVREGQEDPQGPGSSGGYTVSTAPRTAEFTAQQVRVANGEKASLRIDQSMPMQWVQKVESQNAALSVPGASASNTGGGITQAMVWMEAGQSLSVTPHWSGGKQAAKVDIEAQVSAVDERASTDLPATTRQRFSTTVQVPLRQWVTIATTGSAARPGAYSSNGSAGGRKLIQIRVVPD